MSSIMGLFGKKKYSMPPGDPVDWSLVDVKHWLKHKGLEKHKTAFAMFDGKSLMALVDRAKVERLAGFPSDAPSLIDALNELRQAWGRPPVQDTLPTPSPARQPSAHAPAQGRPATPTDADVDSFAQLDIGSGRRATGDSLPRQRSSPGQITMSPGRKIGEYGMNGAQPLNGRSRITADSAIEGAPSLPGSQMAAARYRSTSDSLPDGPPSASSSQMGSARYRLTTDSIPETEPTNGSLALMGNVQGAQDYAEILVQFTSENSIEPVAQYMRALGRVGLGLSEASADNVGIGQLFGSAYNLHCASNLALVNRENCYKLDLLAQDVLRIVDVACKRNAPPSEALLRDLAARMDEASLLVQPYTEPGWLLNVCCNERMKEQFDAVHNGIVDALRSERLDTVLGRPMNRGDYRDIVKTIRRMAKTCGDGNLSTGINALKSDNMADSARDFASALGVDLESLYRELDALPLPGNDLEHLYASLVLGDTNSKDPNVLKAKMGPQAQEELYGIFVAFASFGSRQATDEMDNVKWAKLAKDCKLLDKQLNTTSTDIIFAKVKAKGQRRISFDHFLTALAHVAEKKAVPFEEVVVQVLNSGGPTANTMTRLENVRLHDDKSTYTGVYAKGGPKTTDASKELSALLDRSEADLRGIKKPVSSKGSLGPRSGSLVPEWGRRTTGRASIDMRGPASSNDWGRSTSTSKRMSMDMRPMTPPKPAVAAPVNEWARPTATGAASRRTSVDTRRTSVDVRNTMMSPIRSTTLSPVKQVTPASTTSPASNWSKGSGASGRMSMDMRTSPQQQDWTRRPSSKRLSMDYVATGAYRVTP